MNRFNLGLYCPFPTSPLNSSLSGKLAFVTIQRHRQPFRFLPSLASRHRVILSSRLPRRPPSYNASQVVWQLGGALTLRSRLTTSMIAQHIQLKRPSDQLDLVLIAISPLGI